MKPRSRLLVALSLISVLSLAATHAQSILNDEITVVMGEPVARSAEQAHYLLARMHRENDALRSKPPTDTDLDASAMNGSRLEVFRHTLSVAAGADTTGRRLSNAGQEPTFTFKPKPTKTAPKPKTPDQNAQK